MLVFLFVRPRVAALLNDFHVGGFQTLLARGRFKLDFVVLLKRLKSGALDCCVVNKYIFTSIAGSDEPEPFCSVEPLYGALHNLRIFYGAQRSPAESKQPFASISTRKARRCASRSQNMA